MNGPNFAIIGDIHSQIEPLLQALTYCEENGKVPLLLGDLFDSRVEESYSAEVYREARAATERGAVILRSNHQNKLERYIRGNNVHLDTSINKTLSDFKEAGIPLEEVGEWLNSFPYGVVFQDSRETEYRCAHAMFPRWLLVPPYEGVYYVEQVTRKAADYMLFGPRRPGSVWPQDETRVFWWEEESDRDWVRVAGHYHHVHVSEKSLVLDGGMGGSCLEDSNPEEAHLCLWDVEEKSLVKIRHE